MLNKWFKIAIIPVFLTILGYSGELSIPSTFKYQTINNANEFVEKTIDDFTIKIYSDKNVSSDARALHVGIIVNIDDKSESLMQIQSTYIGGNIIIAIYDKSNVLISTSDRILLNGNVIVKVNVEMTKSEKALFAILINRSSVLNQEEALEVGVRIPTAILIKALQNQEDK